MFLKKINLPKYFPYSKTDYAKKTKSRNRKTIPLNTKSLGNEISAYPFVEIHWLDIQGDAGWSDTKDLKKEELPVCVSKGYLLSQ